MSVKIKINWDNKNVVSESVCIYRADSAFTSNNLPPLLAEIVGDVYKYEDLTTTENQTYFYMLSTRLAGREVFTSCYDVSTKLSQVDPEFSKVKLLMQFDSATPLVDPASGALWTLNGDAFVDTSDKMFDRGGALRLSDSVSSFARSPVLTNLYMPNISGKSLTVEFFFKKTSAIGNAGAVCFQNADNLTNRYAFFIRAGTTNFKVAVYASNGGGTFIDVATNRSVGDWVHVAYVENEEGISRLYIDGAEMINVMAGKPIKFWANTIATIGQSGNNAESFGGLIDGIRVSATARYIGAFTPPAAPFGTRA